MDDSNSIKKTEQPENTLSHNVNPNDIVEGNENMLFHENYKFEYLQKISDVTSNPLISKIDKEHITELIKFSFVQEENKFKNKKSNKIYNLIYVIIGFVFLSFLIYYIGNKNESLLKELIQYGMIFLGGMGFNFIIQKKKK